MWPLTWKVLPFPLQDRSSWQRLVSSAQHLLVLGWAAGVEVLQSPEIVHTEWEEKVNKETERDWACYERKREERKRKHRMSSIMSKEFWILDNEYSPSSSSLRTKNKDLWALWRTCPVWNRLFLPYYPGDDIMRINICMRVKCTYWATRNIATCLLLRLFTITVDHHPLEVKLKRKHRQKHRNCLY